ncbi:MAG: MarR family transcriptional regulator [Fischerella sp.]|uniref:hypothetical protein n=1 Tax=Fischerella sp. TaxID=1191 RepID=UPI00181C2E2F|nr:hypothetical protein [Fischerella sp.]NWF61592.1 MarR family transcriptional regulator [Fischerella sp.]
MTQNNAKIQGKFYPLQHEEWLEACRELTQAQLAVLYYIRTTDPYNQGIEINCAEIARLLSKPERIVHRQTVSRALKELDAKGFIDLELLQVKAKVMAKGIWCDDAPVVCEDTIGVMKHQGCDDAPQVCEDTQGVVTHRDRSLHTTVDRDAPRSIATHHAKSESLTQQESQNSKINKIYIDFLDSLSEGERESFLEFGKNKAAQLPRPPELPLKWIEANFEELAAQWRKTPSGAATNSKWKNHPHYQEWLDKIRSLGFAAFIYETGKRDKEREEFFRWANANNLIWGAES